MSKKMIGKMFKNTHNFREITIEETWISDTGTVFFVSGYDSFTISDLNNHWKPIPDSAVEEE